MEQGAESREKGAERRGKGAESREKGAESREKGAERREKGEGWRVESNMMMRSILYGLIFLGSVLTIACQEQIDWDLEMENELRLVVNGKITNERKAHEVKLTLPVYQINGEEEAVSGAEVYLSDGDSIIIFHEDTSRPGVYMSDPDVVGVVGTTYYLKVEYETYEFFAVAKMDAVSAIKIPFTRLVQDDPPLYETYFGSSDTPARTILELDWSEVSPYDTLPENDNHAIIYGYDFGIFNVDVNELFSPGRDHVYFPPGTFVKITKESLSEGYAEYLRGVLSETSWNGGLFDVKPGDTFSNLSEGAIGYFAATAVIHDSLVFDP